MTRHTHILGKLERRKDKHEKLKTLEPRRVQGTTWPRGIKAKGGIVFCPECSGVFYDKKWWEKEELRKHLLKRAELQNISFMQWLKSMPFRFMCCPADRQKRDQNYEGVVILQDLSSKIKGEVLNLVKNIEQYTRKNQPDIEDKVLKIEDSGDRVIIYTSENQLALRIGKQVHRAFKGGKLEIKFSHQEDAVRVYWNAPYGFA